MQKFGRNNPRPNLNRINEQIRISPVRVIWGTQQLGVMPVSNAMRMAKDEGLDLVEIAPDARPPVCHIMDYGKYKFDQSIREKENRKKQKIVQEKEIRLSAVVDQHDLVTKVDQAKSFLAEGKKVRFLLQFKGRIIVHREIGFQVIDKVLEMLAEVATVETYPRMEGKTIDCRVSPKKEKGNK